VTAVPVGDGGGGGAARRARAQEGERLQGNE